MLKKMMLLATAVAAVAAFAVPASASAHQWAHESVPITSPVTETLSGTAQFLTGGGAGFDCTETHADIDLEPGAGAPARVTSFTVTNPETGCHPKGALALLGCKIKSVATEGTPWTVDVTATTALEITGVKIINNLVAPTPCTQTLGTTQIVLSGTAIATLDSSEAIEQATLGGELASSLGENVNVSGTLNAANPGTYGLVE